MVSKLACITLVVVKLRKRITRKEKFDIPSRVREVWYTVTFTRTFIFLMAEAR